MLDDVFFPATAPPNSNNASIMHEIKLFMREIN